MRLTATTLLLILAPCTQRNLQAQAWRPALVAGAQLALSLDYVQTTQALAQGGRECNPLLRAHPSPGRLLLLGWVVPMEVNAHMPRHLRPVVNVLTILGESYVIYWSVRHHHQ